MCASCIYSLYQMAYRPAAAEPFFSMLPLPSSTGYALASASMRVVYLAITSGLSRKYVIPLKPSASHWVQKLPPLLYRPSSEVFSCHKVGCQP